MLHLCAVNFYVSRTRFTMSSSGMDQIFNAKVSVDPVRCLAPHSRDFDVHVGYVIVPNCIKSSTGCGMWSMAWPRSAWRLRRRLGRDQVDECLYNLLEIVWSWVPKSCPWQALTRAPCAKSCSAGTDARMMHNISTFHAVCLLECHRPPIWCRVFSVCELLLQLQGWDR